MCWYHFKQISCYIFFLGQKTHWLKWEDHTLYETKNPGITNIPGYPKNAKLYLVWENIHLYTGFYNSTLFL